MGLEAIARPDTVLESVTGINEVLDITKEGSCPFIINTIITLLHPLLLHHHTETWSHVLFWSFLLTTLLYLLVGVSCTLCLRVAKKAVNIALPFVYLGYAGLKIVSTDAVASELPQPTRH